MSVTNWKNRTIWTRDNLHVLRGMNSASVDLIYLDPPFNSNRTYSAPIGSKAAGAAFKDAWTLDDADRIYLALLKEADPTTFAVIEAARLAHGPGMAAYIGMMAQRVAEMRRVLKPTGSIYLHCDTTANHYLRAMMDAAFGRSQFRNEIVWCYSTSGRSKRFFAKKHDSISCSTRRRTMASGEIIACRYHRNTWRAITDRLTRKGVGAESGPTRGKLVPTIPKKG